MGDPTQYLPPALAPELVSRFIESLDLPRPLTVTPLEVAAQYHAIYLIQFDTHGAAAIIRQHDALHAAGDGTLQLVLRVSGRHLPRVKTLNEIGVMTWIKKNTKIPVPEIVRFSALEDNLLKHEFTLLEKVRGVSVDKIYDTLTQEAKHSLVDQLIDVLDQLHDKHWETGFVGGLTPSEDGSVGQGPFVDEYFWQTPDIKKYWSNAETLESLNPMAPKGFDGYTDFIATSVQRYAYAIGRHESLLPFRDLILRLDKFVETIQSPGLDESLNDIKYILAHKDLHFGNIMCDNTDPECPITAILDWEFSCVVPAPRWNPPRAFLWNAQNNDQSKIEQEELERYFEKRCKERGLERLLDEVKANEKQQQMQTLTNFLRAIVEVCPRGQATDKVEGWKKVVETNLEAFGL